MTEGMGSGQDSDLGLLLRRTGSQAVYREELGAGNNDSM